MYRVTYLIIPSISVTSEYPSKHSSWWWRRFEDGLKTFFVFVFRRHLDQDEYVHLIHASSEDNLKTSWSRPIYSSWSYVFKTSSRRFQHVFKTSSRRLAKTSSRHLEDVLQRCEIYGRCTKFARVTKVPQILVSRFTTPFSGCLQRRI